MSPPGSTEETLMALARLLKNRRRDPGPENFERVLQMANHQAFPTSRSYHLPAGEVACRFRQTEWADWLDEVWEPYRLDGPTGEPTLCLDFVPDGPKWPQAPDYSQGPPWLHYGAITPVERSFWIYQRPQLRAWCQRGGRTPYRAIVALPSGPLQDVLLPMDLRKPLLDWLSCHPSVPFLGAALNYRGRGIALLGPPNCGKSTLLGHCLEAAQRDDGWGWVCDDPVVLDCRASQATARGLFVGSWANHPVGGEKIFQRKTEWPAPQAEVALQTLVFPEYAPHQSHRLEPLTPVQAFKAWSSSLGLVPGRRDRWFDHQVMGLLQVLPAYRLRMGACDSALISLLLRCLP